MIGRVVGIDIGGANLKLADVSGQARSIPFPLWKQPEQLGERLAEQIGLFAGVDRLAVTMTGELADCYPDKSTGVGQILDAVEEAAAGMPVWVWQTSGEFVTVDCAREFPMLTAAANWHALASWAARALAAEETGLLLDIGSTTVDLIPLGQGMAQPRGRTDYQRLLSGELVYTGGLRTPVCALVQRLAIEGAEVPVAAEWFATIQDAYLLTGELAENRFDCQTADGRPADREHAAQRMARTVCCDAEELTAEILEQMARQVIAAQQGLIRDSLRKVWQGLPQPPAQLVLTGSAAFVLDQILNADPLWSLVPRIWLHQVCGQEMASAACAYAVACLAFEQQMY